MARLAFTGGRLPVADVDLAGHGGGDQGGAAFLEEGGCGFSFPVKPPPNEVGVVIAKDQNGLPLLIEVRRCVHGVSNEELREPAHTVALGDVRIRVPGPIALLQAKIANLADIAQVGRQDARHVSILARLLPAYLRDLQRAAAADGTQECQLIDCLERLLRAL